MKIRIFFILVILVAVSQLSYAIRNDFYFDISPLIEKNKMFSVGIGGIYYEYNSWFQDYKLYINDPLDQNISKRNLSFTFMPYFMVRPINFVELGVSASFLYQRQDSRQDLTGLTNMTDSFSFDAINATAKVTFLDWYLSLGAKVGMSYNFSKSILGENRDAFNFNGAFLLGIVPKVIPINILFAYVFDTRDNLQRDILELGEIIGGIEIITSPFITLYTGVSYVFPYQPKKRNYSYLEPFVKFKATISDFLYMTITYRKVVLGTGNTPNTSTVDFSIEYMFYGPGDWWYLGRPKEKRRQYDY